MSQCQQSNFTSLIFIFFFLYIFLSKVLIQEILFAREIQAEKLVKFGYLCKFPLSSKATSAHFHPSRLVKIEVEDVPGDLQIAHSILFRLLLTNQTVTSLFVLPGAVWIFKIVYEVFQAEIILTFVHFVGVHLFSIFATLEPV